MNHYLAFLIGLLIITVAAELLLRAAAKIAALMGVKPIVIGLTVVSLGTSLPELAVGITAVEENAGAMAIGNIAGTNLVNILLILGLTALLRPLPLHLKSLKLEMRIMIAAALLLLLLSIDGTLSIIDGLLMLALGLWYMVQVVRGSKNESAAIQKEYAEEYSPSSTREQRNALVWLLHFLILASGIAGTIWGASWLVDGATSIARAWGWSESLIGLTIVAIGTSAPELITTLVATFKNDRDVAVGNLLGSSIMNILIILALTSVFTWKGVPVSNDLLWVDIPLALLTAIVCYPVFKSGSRVSRVEGACFVMAYVLYLAGIIVFRA